MANLIIPKQVKTLRVDSTAVPNPNTTIDISFEQRKEIYTKTLTAATNITSSDVTLGHTAVLKVSGAFALTFDPEFTVFGTYDTSLDNFIEFEVIDEVTPEIVAVIINDTPTPPMTGATLTLPGTGGTVPAPPAAGGFPGILSALPEYQLLYSDAIWKDLVAWYRGFALAVNEFSPMFNDTLVFGVLGNLYLMYAFQNTIPAASTATIDISQYRGVGWILLEYESSEGSTHQIFNLNVHLGTTFFLNAYAINQTVSTQVDDVTVEVNPIDGNNLESFRFQLNSATTPTKLQGSVVTAGGATNGKFSGLYIVAL